jgi:predicted nucleic acid-binding protein
MLIAALALALGLTVATYYGRELRQVSGLQVEAFLE